MKKMLSVLAVAALLGGATLVTSGDADAWWGGPGFSFNGGGWGGYGGGWGGGPWGGYGGGWGGPYGGYGYGGGWGGPYGGYGYGGGWGGPYGHYRGGPRGVHPAAPAAKPEAAAE